VGKYRKKFEAKSKDLVIANEENAFQSEEICDLHPMAEPATLLGIMSGTSLDGIDLALCKFGEKSEPFSIQKAVTIPYTEEWVRKLKQAESCSGKELIVLHREYGKYLGEICHDFLKDVDVSHQPSFISSHGHTIFHEPKKHLTFQLGCGASIAVASGIDTICDFRITDVARGGQGAPLVPIGDAMLFGAYTYCLNLGGFVNISHEEKGKRIAFDIAPLNYVLNRVAAREKLNYDEGGALAASGKIIASLEKQLDALEYYSQSAPKSLGREWVEESIFPLLSDRYSTADILHTFCVHAARQTAKCCPQKGTMLVTGGGAYNTFFIEALRKVCVPEIILPDSSVIEFKEALVFAYLGYLRMNNTFNALSSVTGAHFDSISGSIFKA